MQGPRGTGREPRGRYPNPIRSGPAPRRLPELVLGPGARVVRRDQDGRAAQDRGGRLGRGRVQGVEPSHQADHGRRRRRTRRTRTDARPFVRPPCAGVGAGEGITRIPSTVAAQGTRRAGRGGGGGAADGDPVRAGSPRRRRRRLLGCTPRLRRRGRLVQRGRLVRGRGGDDRGGGRDQPDARDSPRIPALQAARRALQASHGRTGVRPGRVRRRGRPHSRFPGRRDGQGDCWAARGGEAAARGGSRRRARPGDRDSGQSGRGSERGGASGRRGEGGVRRRRSPLSDAPA